jgi:hypothetical protein
MHTIEVQEHARKMFEALGPKAEAEAAQKARALEEKGNKAQADDWRRIEGALRLMRGPHVS